MKLAEFGTHVCYMMYLQQCNINIPTKARNLRTDAACKTLEMNIAICRLMGVA